MEDLEGNRGLQLDDLPTSDADWPTVTHFALSFDGYAYAGEKYRTDEDTKACRALFDEVTHAMDERGRAPDCYSVEDLRCALFYLQRLYHWDQMAPGPSEQMLDLGSQLIAEIRRRIESDREVQTRAYPEA